MIDPERKAYIFNELGYTAHSPKQQAIHDSDARFKVLACGRRYGKTTFGGNELTAALMDYDDPGWYWIVGPKYTLGEKEFRVVFANIIRKLKLGAKVKKSYNVKQGDMVIEMPWGSILEVKSAERQDTLLGEGLSGVVMAEAARHTSETWEQYVRPALADKRGWAIFASTPRGYNWYQGLWMLGQNRLMHPQYESWRLPSWENPIVYPGGREDPEIIEQEQRVSPQWFAQELAAEFTAYAGKIYDEFDQNIHVKHIEYNPLWTNVWALDYGWTNQFVCLDVMIDPEDNFHVWREYMVTEKTTFEHAGLLLKRSDNPPDYHVDWGGGDPRGPDQANTIAIITGVQIYSSDIGEGNAHESWTLGVEHVKQLLKVQPNGLPKLTIDPSCVNLIRQMDQLHAPDPKEGKNAPEGQHKHDDHGPDALRYLVGQYFESGAGSSLGDIYGKGMRQTEAMTFFQNNSPMARNARF
jgi:hypothetical protein